MIDVSFCLLAVERLQARHRRNSLAELLQFWAGKFIRKGRLARKYDLNQLQTIRLKIRKQAHRFQNLVAKVLSLVNHHHNRATEGCLAIKEIIQLLVHPYGVLTFIPPQGRRALAEAVAVMWIAFEK